MRGLSDFTLQDRQIDLGILADDLGLEARAVGEDHADVVGVADHVIVGDDDARGSITKPEPSEFERRRGGRGALSPSPPWPTPIEELLEQVLEGRARRQLRQGPVALASTVVEAEMLTTAPVTSSARSAKDSGAERAKAGSGTAGATMAKTAKQDAASRRMDAETARPGRRQRVRGLVHRRSSLGEYHIDCRSRRHSSADCGGSAAGTRAELTGAQPDDHDANERGDDADEPHPVARAVGGLIHGPPHAVGEGRKQNALDRESEAEGCNQVQHQALLRRSRLGAGRAGAAPRRSGPPAGR